MKSEDLEALVDNERTAFEIAAIASSSLTVHLRATSAL